MEPFLDFFHQSSKSLVVAARRGHIFATFCLSRAGEAGHDASRAGRATYSTRETGSPRRGVGAEAVGEHVTLAKHSPSVAGLDESSHRLLLKRSVAAALPAGPFACGIMRRAPNFWSNLFRPIQGPKASILWARPHVCRQPSWSSSAKTEVLLLSSRRSLARPALLPLRVRQVCPRL